VEDQGHVWFQSKAVANATAEALGGQYLNEAVSQGVWHVVRLPPGLADQVRRLRLPFYPDVSLTVVTMLGALKQLVQPGASPSPSPSAGGSSPQEPAGRVVPFSRPTGRG
jgi:hypothetical protein